MTEHLYQWIDIIWLPITWFSVHKPHRIYALLFVVTCILTLRTQVELMQVIGFEGGMTPLMKSPAFDRGLILYSIFIAIYLVMAHFSPRTTTAIFIAASVSLYILAFCISMLAMAV